MNHKRVLSIWILLLGMLGTAVPLPAHTAETIVAIKTKRILPVTSPPINHGIILIRKGKIEAVGQDVKIPDQAQVIDASDRVVIPGLIDAQTTLAERGRDDEVSVTPDISALDAFDFFASHYHTLAGGVTSAYISPGQRRLVPGQSAVVKLYGETPEHQIIRENVGLSIVLGPSSLFPPPLFDPPVPPDPNNPIKPVKRQLPTTRMGQMSLLRSTFDQTQWAQKHPDQPLSYPDLIPVLKRKQTAYITCHTAMDIRNALTLARSYRLKCVLVGATEAYQVLDAIKAAHVSVIFDLGFQPGHPSIQDHTRSPLKGIPQVDTLVALADANIPFALTGPSDRTSRDLLFLAGIAVNQGITPEQALASVTIEPARILGIAKQVGSIEKGKDADLVFLTDSPFDLNTRVEQTLVNGHCAYHYKKPSSEDRDQPELAIKAGKILTVSRGQITNGLILIRDGKVTYAGPNKDLPADVNLIDASDKVVIPGMIDCHSHLGLHADQSTDQPYSQSPTTGPDSSDMRLASIATALGIDEEAYTQTLQAGVTSILLAPETRGLVSGNGAVVKLAGENLEDRIVKAQATVSFSMTSGNPRRGKIWQARELLKRARSYSEQWDRYEEDFKEYQQRKARSKPDLVKPPTLPRRDTNLELLRGLFKRQSSALVRVERDDDIRNTLRVFREEFNLDTILLGAQNAYRLIPECRKYNIGLALGPQILHYDKEKAINNAALLTAKGLRVALQTSATSETRLLPVNATYAIRFGMDPDEALQSVTLTPARLLHVEDRIGSIDVGKDADLVILSGDPFHFSTQVHHVFVNGKIVYRRNVQ